MIVFVHDGSEGSVSQCRQGVCGCFFYFCHLVPVSCFEENWAVAAKSFALQGVFVIEVFLVVRVDYVVFFSTESDVAHLPSFWGVGGFFVVFWCVVVSRLF